MMLANYFLENSAMLKNLTLRLANHTTREKPNFRELFRMPRGSTKCEVVVRGSDDHNDIY